MSDPALDVLVVGAGTTGLTVALAAHAHGARVRVIERRTELFRPSRALIMHPRTLEMLRPLGVTDALLFAGDSAPAGVVRLGKRTVGVVLDPFGAPGTAYPHLLFVRQAVVERILAEALEERGIHVEWGRTLVRFDATAGGVTGTVTGPGGRREEIRSRHLAACDGQDSGVRRALGIAWRGGTYPREVVLADVALEGAPQHEAARVAVTGPGVLIVFPLGELAPWRMLATRPSRGRLPPGRSGSPVPLDQLRDMVHPAAPDLRIASAHWSTRIVLQHRLAGSFRRGPVFLAGDAAHAQSPAGGLGMNAGMMDAVSLGWRLGGAAAMAVRGRGDPEPLLWSYESERRRADRRILRMTHLVFWAESGSGLLPRLGRAAAVRLGPLAVPVALRQRRIIRAALRTLGQLRVRYRRGPLAVEGAWFAPGPRAGERLPDGLVRCDGRRAGLHSIVASPGIHVLVSRDASAPVVHAGQVTVHRIDNWAGRAVLAVRPDGYIGCRVTDGRDARLRNWLFRAGGMPIEEEPSMR